MRSVFDKTIPDTRVSSQEGSFVKTGIEDGWADLVIMAQVSFLSSLSSKIPVLILIAFRDLAIL